MTYAVIGGGYNNANLGSFGTIGGGNNNTNNQPFATIAGGYRNTAGYLSTIGGGYYNSAIGWGSFVGGGGYDGYSTAPNSAGGFGSVIGGGIGNQTFGQDSIIGGGSFNLANAEQATIGGGTSNTNAGYAATIGGGYQNNIIYSGSSGTIGGGWGNTLSHYYTTIGGGVGNSVAGEYGTISGGYYNLVTTNWATVGGGYGNTASGPASVVSGGGMLYLVNNTYLPAPNIASGTSATVPGGVGNLAIGNFSFAAGYYAGAYHDGTFVWADSSQSYPNFASTTTNEFSVRARNGVRIQTDVGIHLSAGDEPIIVRDWDVFATNAPAAKIGIGRWGLFMEPFSLTMGIPGDDLSGRSFQVAKYNTNGTSTTLLQVNQGGGVVFNAGTNNIELASGGIKVTGAGIGTGTAVFVHRATAANIDPAGAHRTTINNPYCNGDPNAVLIVTANYNPSGTGSVFQTHPYGVFYNTSLARWQIFNEDLAALTVNTAFNVMIVKP